MLKKILSSITLLSVCSVFFLSCVSAKSDSLEKYYRASVDGKSSWYKLARLFDTDGKEINPGYGIEVAEYDCNGTLTYRNWNTGVYSMEN